MYPSAFGGFWFPLSTYFSYFIARNNSTRRWFRSVLSAWRHTRAKIHQKTLKRRICPRGVYEREARHWHPKFYNNILCFGGRYPKQNIGARQKIKNLRPQKNFGLAAPLMRVTLRWSVYLVFLVIQILWRLFLYLSICVLSLLTRWHSVTGQLIASAPSLMLVGRGVSAMLSTKFFPCISHA